VAVLGAEDFEKCDFEGESFLNVAAEIVPLSVSSDCHGRRVEKLCYRNVQGQGELLDTVHGRIARSAFYV
jgi:hypothetical protein